MLAPTSRAQRTIAFAAQPPSNALPPAPPYVPRPKHSKRDAAPSGLTTAPAAAADDIRGWSAAAVSAAVTPLAATSFGYAVRVYESNPSPNPNPTPTPTPSPHPDPNQAFASPHGQRAAKALGLGLAPHLPRTANRSDDAVALGRMPGALKEVEAEAEVEAAPPPRAVHRIIGGRVGGRA